MRLEDKSDREETTTSTEGGDASDGRSPGDPLERLDILSFHGEQLFPSLPASSSNLTKAKLFEPDSPRTNTMTESHPGSWTESMSGRERVRYVVELLDEPTPVQEIADRADVSRATADDELQQLKGDDWVTETTVDGTKAYDLNPVRMLFDEVTDLIEDHSRDELESQLTELRDEQEELAAGYDVESLDEFREQLAEENFSAAELRERRNVIATWEAINTELGLVKHALQLYDDVVELSSPRTDSHSTLA